MSDFRSLCDRVWNGSPGRHGDVIELRLTDDSKRELCADALVETSMDWGQLQLFRVPLEKMTSSGVVTEAVNPVTRSVVKITGKNTVDQALISYGAHAESELTAI